MISKHLQPSVVLVSDRTLSGNYKVLFEGIFATMQTTQVPELIMRRFLSPPIPTDRFGAALTAVLGLRRIESALEKYTSLEADDIVCTTPEKLKEVIGPWVKVVAFSSSDPLGMGMSNTTTTNFWKGRLYTKYWTERILKRLSELKQKFKFKIVVGGAGAWQWKLHPEQIPDVDIDLIFEGYFEKAGPKIFSEMLEGKNPESHYIEKETCSKNIQPIQHASMLGIIELSRGCGRGCRFCSMAKQKMEHLEPDLICADLETNVAAGIKSVVSSSEDFFRYGAAGVKPDFEKLYNLLNQIRQIEGLSFMQIDHGNIASILQLTNEQLREIRRLLTWHEHTDYLWVNMGAETANGRLLERSCPGKITPFDAENWSETVIESAERMIQCGFFPVYSIIIGMPGEEPSDVADTIKMVKELGQKGSVIFPVFYEPVLEDEVAGGRRFTLEKMRADHLALYRTCYEINFRMVPKLIWDNQRAGGVPLIKRLLLQMLGRGEIFSWRRTFKSLDKRLRLSQQAVLQEKQAYAG